jgi:hypothetical protein
LIITETIPLVPQYLHPPLPYQETLSFSRAPNNLEQRIGVRDDPNLTDFKETTLDGQSLWFEEKRLGLCRSGGWFG